MPQGAKQNVATQSNAEQRGATRKRTGQARAPRGAMLTSPQPNNMLHAVSLDVASVSLDVASVSLDVASCREKAGQKPQQVFLDLKDERKADIQRWYVFLRSAREGGWKRGRERGLIEGWMEGGSWL